MAALPMVVFMLNQSDASHASDASCPSKDVETAHMFTPSSLQEATLVGNTF